MTELALDPVSLTKVAAQIAQQEKIDLIFSGGGQQADWDSHALEGAATAERLHWPQVAWVNALEVQGQTLTGRHDAEDGSEMFSGAVACRHYNAAGFE